MYKKIFVSDITLLVAQYKIYFAKLCNFRVCSFVFYQVAIRMPAHWDRNNEQLSVLSYLLTSIIMQFWLWSPSGWRGFQYGSGTRKSCHAGGIQSGTSDPFTALSSSGWQFQIKLRSLNPTWCGLQKLRADIMDTKTRTPPSGSETQNGNCHENSFFFCRHLLQTGLILAVCWIRVGLCPREFKQLIKCPGCISNVI